MALNLPAGIKPYYLDAKAGIAIINADCRDALALLEPVEHVIADPPFARNVYRHLGMPNTNAGSGTPTRLAGYEYSSASQRRKGHPRLGIQNHQYSSASIVELAAGGIGYIDEMLDDVASEIARLVKRWAIVFSDVESCHLWREQLERSGMRYIRTGAWVKIDPMPQFSGDRPAVGFEPCTIAHAQGPMRWNGGGHAAVWRHGITKVARPDHPCPKPLPLMHELVSLFTDYGETILDPFCGSGTTLLASKNLGRRTIGIEIEERYCEIAAKRLSQDVMPLEAPPPTIQSEQSTIWSAS